MKNAKEILKDKFWLVIDNGKNVGTISFDNDHYIVNSDGKYEVYKNKSNIKKKLGDLTWTQLKIQETTQYDVHKFVCNSKPYNSMWDLKKKLPLFTKSGKSKSVYCAGYYIIKFNKGWVKSFCPKLITIERYDYKGPFKTEIEMRQQLSIENAKSTN
tara:strand:+ start:1039 stop:1509 length:471 start_codon:yes stop_codon:yes gene_type:complete